MKKNIIAILHHVIKRTDTTRQHFMAHVDQIPVVHGRQMQQMEQKATET